MSISRIMHASRSRVFSLPLSALIRRPAGASCRAVSSAAGLASTPTRSIFARVASASTRILLFAAVGLAMTTVPVLDTVKSVVSPPTDAETLAMFNPSDEEAQAKEAFINALPLVAALRANPDFTELRHHLKMPEAWRRVNLTAGVLQGPGRMAVPPLSFFEKGGKSLVQIFHAGTDLCGHAGVVHGGFLATMLDEGLGVCCFPALPHRIGMTVRLEVSYKAPAVVDQYLVLRATTTKVEGRKAWVEGHIETLPKDEEKPVVLATGSALFISPKQAAAMAKIYAVN